MPSEFAADTAVVIANPAAAAGRVGRDWDRITGMLKSHLGDLRCLQTSAQGHATELAAQAVRDGATELLSLGGDGTHNEVVNGIVDAGATDGRVTLSVLPAGTGGDFRRILEHSDTLDQAVAHLPRAAAHRIDLLSVDYVADDGSIGTRACLNMASCGVSGLVCRIANASSKKLGGQATFFLSTLRAQLRYKPSPVRVFVDDQQVGEWEITTLAGANGRFAGGGMMFTPDARLSDGLLDVCVLEQQSLVRTVGMARYIYDGRHGDRPGVHLLRGHTLRVEPVDAARPAWVEIDGEAPGIAPMTVRVLPGAIGLRGARADVL
ncbi:MAG: diacylglycerol kinase family lipid kinase [Alphaproteobacteria bacterium]|nr:diacylglycerol kinase family lipid kinase [Alphaproteobacteria bacterium]